MNDERRTTSEEPDSESVTGPSGKPPDEGLTYDPEMTDADEANVPPASTPDPRPKSPEHKEAERNNPSPS